MNRKLVQGECPFCGSTNIEYDSIQSLDANCIYYPAHCLDCKKDFEEQYTLVFDGCYVYGNNDNSTWIEEGSSIPDEILIDDDLEILDENYLKSLLKK